MKRLQSHILPLVLTLLPATALAGVVTGTVKDPSGEPLIGATVFVEGTSTAVTTDIDGNFSIDVPQGKSLRISYVGFSPATIKTSPSKTSYDVVLKEDAMNLDDVVVVGYGTQKRSELTGAISSVKGSDIRDFSTTSVADALAGMAAGVAVTKSTGNPGEAPDIIIRGAGSVNGMAPLYIVDGVRQATGFSFNTNDIESIEVLKDAGSCAIYGAEAAGGVILVTTRRGSKGKATLNVNARYGIRRQSSGITLLTRDEFIAAKALTGMDILAQDAVDSADQLPDCDWMDVMYGNGHEQEYNVSLSGGSENLRYYLSGGFYDEKGVYLDSKADRFSFRTNVDWDISKIFSVGTSSYANFLSTNPTKVNSIYTNAVPFRTVPTMNPVDEDGNFASTPFYLNGPNLYGNEMAYHQ